RVDAVPGRHDQQFAVGREGQWGPVAPEAEVLRQGVVGDGAAGGGLVDRHAAVAGGGGGHGAAVGRDELDLVAPGKRLQQPAVVQVPALDVAARLRHEPGAGRVEGQVVDVVVVEVDGAVGLQFLAGGPPPAEERPLRRLRLR